MYSAGKTSRVLRGGASGASRHQRLTDCQKGKSGLTRVSEGCPDGVWRESIGRLNGVWVVSKWYQVGKSGLVRSELFK